MAASFNIRKTIVFIVAAVDGYEGYSGYFTHPDGYVREVAYAPFLRLEETRRLPLETPEEAKGRTRHAAPSSEATCRILWILKPDTDVFIEKADFQFSCMTLLSGVFLIRSP